MKATYYIDKHDDHGDCFERGIYLNFNDMVSLRFNDLHSLISFSSRVREIIIQIAKEHPELKPRL